MVNSSNPVVALFDDDSEIRTLVCDYLAHHGITCHGIATETDLTRLLASTHVDLVLLDIMLPESNGLAICQQLRESSRTPVILLTALAEESDRVLGLEMGADDYLTKPFSARELLARIRAVLRRTSNQLWVHHSTDQDEFTFAGWRLSTKKRTLIDSEDTLISLTGGEFDLLLALVRNAGQVLNRDRLLELTKGRKAQPFDRSIDVQLSRLRKKLGDEGFVKTVRGGGYLFAEEVDHD